MSVSAFPQADADFESFIDEDAVGDSSSTPSEAATTSFTSSVESGIHQTMSLPNTPKLASGLSLSQPMGSSLHNLSFDWEDEQQHRGSGLDASLVPSQSAWRKPLDDSFNLPAQPHHAGAHQRSMSLSMHDVAPQFLDDLRAQQPAPFFPAYPHQPFVKMEPDTYGHPFPAMNANLPAEMGPALAPPLVPAPASAPDAMETDGTTPPQEKKRKIDPVPKPKKASKKKSTAAATAAAATAAAANSSGPVDAANNKSEPATTTTDGNNTAEPAQKEEASTDSTSNEADTTAADASVASAEDGAAHSSATDGAASPERASSPTSGRKPAAKSKKPPPSASQVTESGKPFPVIDTSATHSSLFIPPDTSGLTKREARLVKNRAAAFLSRQRKREQFEMLEKQCKSICRLTWKMWESIAGTEAGVDRIDESAMAAILTGECPDVRDCLEQIINNKGASIAPTEESIANGTHSTLSDSSRQNAESRSSPAASTKSGGGAGSKREREEGNSTSEQQTTIDQLRAQLQAAEQRESALQAALVEARAHVPPPVPFGPAPYPGMAPPPHGMPSFGPHEPQDALYYPWAAHHPQQRIFRDNSGLSLTVAPQMSAKDVDMASTPTVEQGPLTEQAAAAAASSAPASMRVNPGPAPESSQSTSSASSSAAVAAPASASSKKTTGSMALMALLAGFALFGSGGVQSADAPRMGITRLGPMSGASASIGSLFDPLASTSSTNPLANLFGRRRRKNANGEEDEEMTGIDGGSGAPSSHLSADDLALSTEHHLHNIAAQMMDDVTDMLPQCSLDDSAAKTPSRHEAKRPMLRRMQSDSSLIARHRTGGITSWSKGGPGSSANVAAAAAAAAEHLQQGLILLGEDDRGSMDHSDSDSAPRKLKLFLRRRALSDVATQQGVNSIVTRPASPSGSGSSDHDDDIFEDAVAGTRTPTDSTGSDVAASAPPQASGRIAAPPPSYMELEFSLSSKRVVKDEQELASLIQRAAQRAAIGGGAAFSA